ncbi:MAG TPA: bacterioferritin [Acidobacteriota bacterium]|nr:bacterioferritin [Acidobacteriota bacterium]
MKGDEKVIDILNQVLRKELTGINQYFMHAKICKSWGYEKLYKHIWDESIEEMKHADEIIDRLLFLEGTPSISAYDKIMVGATVKQQLENDLGLETAALAVLRPGIRTCLAASDDASKNLLEKILIEEEKHVDWLESQLRQIDEVGFQNYLAQQIKGKD